MKTVAEQTRMWRAKYRVTQAEAARVADCNVKTWQRWERGEALPSPDRQDELAFVLARTPRRSITGLRRRAK